MQKPLSKEGYFSKIADNFSNAMTAKWPKTAKIREPTLVKIHDSFERVFTFIVLGIYNFGQNLPLVCK